MYAFSHDHSPARAHLSQLADTLSNGNAERAERELRLFLPDLRLRHEDDRVRSLQEAWKARAAMLICSYDAWKRNMGKMRNERRNGPAHPQTFVRAQKLAPCAWKNRASARLSEIGALRAAHGKL